MAPLPRGHGIERSEDTPIISKASQTKNEILACKAGNAQNFVVKRTAPLPPRSLSVWYQKIFPLLRALIKLKYFSMEVEGLENIPPKGPLVYVGNHAGWFTLDSFFFALALSQKIKPERLPYAVIHDLLVTMPVLKPMFENKGVIPASWLHDLRKLPRGIEVFGIYPEGEDGNCKPFWKAYQMQEWKTGFLKIALAKRAKIIPVAMIGGEESCPVGWSTKRFRKIIGAQVPIPLSFLPLPTKWKFIFHKPIDLAANRRELLSNQVLRRMTAAKIRAVVQQTLDREAALRPLGRFAAWLSGNSGSDVRKTTSRSVRPFPGNRKSGVFRGGGRKKGRTTRASRPSERAASG